MSIYLWGTFLRIRATLVHVSSFTAMMHLRRWYSWQNRVHHHNNHDAQLRQNIAGKPADSSG